MKKNIMFRLHIPRRAVDLCGQEVILPFDQPMHTGEMIMKKLLVLGMLLAMSTGCGRNWFPHLFRGAPCTGLCSRTAPPMAEPGCSNCNGAGYESYVPSEGIMTGEAIGSAPIGSTYESVPPAMAPLPSGTIVTPAR
jgi:hypothetical protein